MQVEDRFSYEVTDPGGKTDVTMLTIDVNGTNDNPNAVDNSNMVVELGDGPTEGPEFGPFSDDTAWGNVKANDSDDDDRNYQLRINGIAKGDLDDDVAANYDADDFDGIGGMPTTIAGDWGTLTIDRFGQYQYTLNQEATDPLDTGDVEHDTFTYRVIDDNGDFDLATLTFEVHGNNDAPVAVDDYVSEYMQVTNEFEAAEVDVTGAQQSISMDGISVTAYVDNDHKPWTNGDHRHPDLTTKTLNGYTGIGVNSDKDIDSGEVDLTNKGEDEYLVVSMDNPAESVTIELGALFANSSYDGGRTEYAQATAWGRNANNQLVKLGTVDVSGDSDGLVEFTMEGYDFDIERIVLQPVTNYAGKNGNNSDFVLVSVEASSHTGIDEGQAEPVIIKIADILANDYDVDALDTVSFAGLVANSENGGWAEVVGDEIWFHVDADTNMNNGATDFEYSVTDGDLTSTATVHLEVNPTNDAPTAETFAVETNEDNAISINVLAHAADVDLADNPDAGDILSIDSLGTPEHGSVEIVNGEVLYTPDADYNGPDSFTYTVTDGQGGSVTETVNVTVNPLNDAPIGIDDVGPGIFVTASDTPVDHYGWTAGNPCQCRFLGQEPG